MHVILSLFQRVHLKTHKLFSFSLKSKLKINVEEVTKLIIGEKLINSINRSTDEVNN